MAKAKRYEEGGDVDTGVAEGANAGIGDDTRARAMAWLKKQQEGGGEEAAPAAPVAPRRAPAKVTDTGDELARLAARTRKPAYETAYDRMNRQNREASAAKGAARDAERATLAKNIREKRVGTVNPKTLLPTGMKKGGSVSASRRADGIAMRGKTRGKMV